MKLLKNESQLIFDAKQGNSLAFEKLVLHYLGLINRLSNEYRAEGYDREDFIQEGCVALLSAVKSYDKDKNSSFKNYAMLCIKNRFLTIVRQSKSEKKLPMEAKVSIDDVEITDNGNNPESLLLYQERLASLKEKAKEVLSKREYSVFMLYIEGYSYKEISNNLKITVKAVDNALSRAKKKLL